MADTSARLLRLLSLLQTRRDWSGADLAEQLRVTRRTVRRDIDRLRELGYPVNATRGAPGYRLGVGAALPPLLLDDDEAVAVAIGLRTATAGSVTGIEETSLRALAKLEQVLPSRLRHRVRALQQTTVRAGTPPGPQVDPDTLVALSDACARRERLRFDYTDHTGRHGVRSVEPHRLVNWDRRWYLVAWDLDRDAWRTFRADRVRPRTPAGPRFPPRESPDGDVTAYLSRQLSQTAWPWQATVTMHRPAGEVAERVWPGMGAVEAVDDDSCLLHLGAESPDDLAWMTAVVGIDFTVTEPPELVEAIRELGTRCHQAVDGGSPAADP